ncbi:LysR family transcriptional regulator [Acidisoma cellulosilyticum]|nr:LysR family transcriptional regulator [Acidisoma cellulosilyticum]
MVQPADYGALRAFAAVAETLSFARAAETLGVSSSALSQTIRGLEDRVGARLLNRTTRSVSLTEAGTNLLHEARPAIDALAAAFGRARHSEGRPAGVVKILSFRIAADIFLLPMLARFQQNFPAVVLDITLDDAVVDLVAAGFDAGIRVGEVIERDMVAVKLGDAIRQIAVASPAYIAECGAPDSPADLLHHRCINWRWPGKTTLYEWEFCENDRWFSVAVDGPLIVNSRAFAVQAAANGVGIAFVKDSDAAGLIAEGTLVPLLEQWSAPFEGFYLCYPQQRHMAPAIRAFIDALTASVKAGSQPLAQ